eukprot:363692-Chlamydomonas_euryale.AAC.13
MGACADECVCGCVCVWVVCWDEHPGCMWGRESSAGCVRRRQGQGQGGFAFSARCGGKLYQV